MVNAHFSALVVGLNESNSSLSLSLFSWSYETTHRLLLDSLFGCEWLVRAWIRVGVLEKMLL